MSPRPRLDGRPLCPGSPRRAARRRGPVPRASGPVRRRLQRQPWHDRTPIDMSELHHQRHVRTSSLASSRS